MPPEPKTCAACGRTIEWRKKWARDWDDVRWCSAACRRRGVTDQDIDLERRVLAMLGDRARTSSICPSDVARAAAPDEWRPLMEPVRRAARRLVQRGEVEITQKGAAVDPSTVKGPIRIRLPR